MALSAELRDGEARGQVLTAWQVCAVGPHELVDVLCANTVVAVSRKIRAVFPVIAGKIQFVPPLLSMIEPTAGDLYFFAVFGGYRERIRKHPRWIISRRRDYRKTEFAAITDFFLTEDLYDTFLGGC